MTLLRRSAALVAVSTIAASTLTAQQSTRSIHPTAPPVAQAAARSGPVTIDGRLAESAWAAATPITHLTQSEPREGMPPTQRTEIRILYDEDALYVGARVFDSLGAAGIRAPLARRDQLLDANGNNGSFNSLTTDKIVVMLDPYHNHLDEVWFEINPAGVRGDQFNGDPSWDPIWEAGAHVDSLGWTAEMRIPYSQLRFSRDSLQTWGLQVWRYSDRNNEKDMWAFWRANEAGGPAFFGHLSGLRIGSRPRQFELLPYVLSGAQFKYAPPDDPYHGTRESKLQAGVDLKYLLTSNLTLDATVNPDFGQVEVDPATINLSAYETYYDEKRPFFVAGSSSFDFGGSNCMFCSNFSSLDLFYSRRIGRVPQLNGWLDTRSAFDDTPGTTSILGAAKVTGRTGGGVSVGLLDALTGQETAHYLPLSGGLEREQAVEPLTNYFVGRVKKELQEGATTIGGMFTSTFRHLDDSLLTSQLRSHAEVAGFDFSHNWSRRTYRWIGSLAVSSVGGSASAIDLTQQSSAHYFDRPDRRVTTDGLFDTRYDPNATSLQGYGFYTRVAKNTGNWIWETAQNWRSPGFETNDLSFQSRADYKWMNFNVGRQWTTPASWYRNRVIIAGAQQQFNYDGDRTDQQAQAFYGMEFLNYWNLRTFYIYKPSVDDDRLTRGGPVVKTNGYHVGQVTVSTDARSRAVFNLSVEEDLGIDDGTRSVNFGPGVALKPASNVFVSLTPSFGWDENSAQYVTPHPDPTATAFYGTRYVFAYLKSRTWSLDTRINWTFTPELTLQLYAQPYFSTGNYTSFREFAAPRTAEKVIYGKDVGSIAFTPGTGGAPGTYRVDPDGTGPAAPFVFTDPDFAYRSLIGNAVVRWEYRPGSTVYFVWTQNRSGADAVGTFDFARDRAELFRDRPTNIFQVKANFWIGR